MRPIDADSLKYRRKDYGGHDDVSDEERGRGILFLLEKDIDTAPTVDLVKHGFWQITEAYPHNIYCSECHIKFAQTHWAVWEDGSLPRRYCPNCGARMNGGEE